MTKSTWYNRVRGCKRGKPTAAALVAIYLLLALPALFATTVTGTKVDAAGRKFNGYVSIELALPATDTVNNVAVAATPIRANMVNGQIKGYPYGGPVTLADVANLQPQNLFYTFKYYNQYGQLIEASPYVVTGTNFDIGTAIPTTQTIANVSYSGIVFTNVISTYTAAQLFKAGPIYDIQAFNADPNNSADSTTFINAALAAAKAAGGRAYCTRGTFKTTAQISTLGADFDFSNCTFSVNGNPAVAFDVSSDGTGSPTGIVTGANMAFPAITNNAKPGTGWAGTGTGIRLVNVQDSTINLTNQVYGFETGMLITSFGGSGSGVYDTIINPSFFSNHVSIKIGPGDASSWTNQITFIGGRLSIASAEGPSIAGAYLVYVQKSDTHGPNNILFEGVAMEGDGPQYYVVNGGEAIKFHQCRWETTATTPTVLYQNNAGFATEGTDNVIDGGYGVWNVAIQYDTNYATNTGPGRNTIVDPRGTTSSYVTGGLYGWKLRNTSSSANSSLTLYEAGVKFPDDNTGTNATLWSVGLSAQALHGKRQADTNDRLQLDFVNGRVYTSNGTLAPACYFGGFSGTSNNSSCQILPVTDATLDLGTGSFRWRNIQLSGTATIGGVVSLGSGAVAANNATGNLLAITASLSTAAAVSDLVTVTGMTTAGHCSLTPTNAAAATDSTSTYISSKAAGQIVVTHPANAGRTWDVVCWPN